jgi:hypothetical protein
LDISEFSGGLAAAKSRNGRYGFIDLAGNWRVGPRFKMVSSFSEGYAYTTDAYLGEEGFEDFIDSRGERAFGVDIRFPEDRSASWPFQVSEGLVAFMDEDNAVGFLDTKGEVALRPEWEDALPFSEGLAAVQVSRSWRFIDPTGRIVVQGPFEKVQSFAQGLAAAKEGELWGYIDRQGAWTISPTFAAVYPFRSEGLAQAKTVEGYTTWIDRTGRPVWTDGPPLAPAWKEDFNDNARQWAVGENQNAKAAIEKGFYRITSKTQGGDLEGLILPIDREKDYLLSARLRYDSPSQKEAIGLAWDLKDAGNSYSFVIRPLGQFAVIRLSEGTPTFLVNWTAQAAIKKGQTDNILEVRKTGQVLEFYANGSLLGSLPYETCSGQWIGLACYGATTLIVDSLALRQATK